MLGNSMPPPLLHCALEANTRESAMVRILGFHDFCNIRPCWPPIMDQRVQATARQEGVTKAERS